VPFAMCSPTLAMCSVGSLVGSWSPTPAGSAAAHGSLLGVGTTQSERRTCYAGWSLVAGRWPPFRQKQRGG
jgi:hypothetical protein